MQSKLHIFYGNQLEVLVHQLAELTATQSQGGKEFFGPSQPETILVQSKGMQRWISMEIAKINGICANMAFPFPNTFIEKIYADVFGTESLSNPFEPDILTFRIMSILNELIDEKPFTQIRRYLLENKSELKTFQLSRKIADIFDQYLVFRPDMILGWEQASSQKSPTDGNWQSILWNRLCLEINKPHRAHFQSKLVRRLMDTNMPLSVLPHRVSVFGISYIPVFHLQVLNALAYRIPVYLFLLNPCRQYWADIVSDRQEVHIRTGNKAIQKNNQALHMERGNRLLASWGFQGKQFFSLTQQLDGLVEEVFEDNRAGTLLCRIQQDILDLIDRGESHESDEVFKTDGSIQFHVCHSPMREVEVLYDQLLGILDDNNDIFPGDILVMTPDIGKYAPCIHAVFGKTGGHETHNRIPYTLADQSIPKESRLIEAFLTLLQLKDSRFEASQIMALLEYSAVRKRFGIEMSDLSLIESWMKQANIRWGWDGLHRKQHGLPGYQENTWRSGLDSLLLGYAMSSEDALFAGLRPHEGIEGSDSRILGAFVHFADTLRRLFDDKTKKAHLHQWSAIFIEWLEAVFEPDDHASHDFQILRDTIEKLDHINNHLGHSEKITFEVVRQFLSDNLNRSSYGTGFLNGSVTFCAMLPMRSIPSKVICLLGMQHDAFPQDLREPTFNLIQSEPRSGDRSKREDDKYLFLEALLSARRVFYLSYIGRDIQDNSPKPPSVLVNELMEYIEDDFRIHTRDMITEHPLHAFSPSYFISNNLKLFSYSKENLEAAQNLSSTGAHPVFFKSPIPEPPEEWRNCSLSQLLQFFSHPIRYLMEQRLGIYLRDISTPLVDEESFYLNPLENYLLSQNMLQNRRGEVPLDKCYRLARSAGNLPHGTAGLAVFDEIDKNVNRYINILEQNLPEDPPESLQVDLHAPPFHVSGKLDGIYPEVMIVSRFAKMRPRDILSAFLNHLALSIFTRKSQTTLLVCKDQALEFGPLSDPRKILSNMLTLFWKGLQFPLPFFERASYVYGYGLIYKQQDKGKAYRNAVKEWIGGDYKTGESQDVYIAQCYKGRDSIPSDFESIALEVYSPVFESCKSMDIIGKKNPMDLFSGT